MGRTADAAPYAISPVFDEDNLPASLRREHHTKPHTWGIARILQGDVAMVYVDTGKRVILTPETPGLLAPGQPHYVEIIGPVRMQVEFYRHEPALARP